MSFVWSTACNASPSCGHPARCHAGSASGSSLQRSTSPQLWRCCCGSFTWSLQRRCADSITPIPGYLDYTSILLEGYARSCIASAALLMHRCLKARMDAAPFGMLLWADKHACLRQARCLHACLIVNVSVCRLRTEASAIWRC